MVDSPLYLNLSIDPREIGGLTANDTAVLLLNALLATKNDGLRTFQLRHGNLQRDISL